MDFRELVPEFENQYLLGLVGLMVVAVIIGGVMAGNSDDRNLESYMSDRGFKIDPNGSFRVQSTGEESISGIKIDKIVAVDEPRRVELEIFSGMGEGFAQNYIEDRKNEIMSMYTDTPSPYAAVPGRDVNCPERFTPNMTRRSTPDANYTYYSVYAGENYRMGVCSEKEVFYEVKMAIIYCSEGPKILEIREYRPTGYKNNSLVKKVSCT